MSTIAVLHEGQWKVARILGYGVGGSLAAAMLNESYVTITTSGSTFEPIVELVSGSTATIHWVDLSSGQQLAIGPSPSINWGTVAERRIGLRVDSATGTHFDDVVTLNFGFNHTQDSGAYNIGASYNHPAQQVTGVTGLQLLVNLRRFLAANTPLTGALDCSGLAQLEFIECFNAQVASINLTGCDSLIRLCMERNHLLTLDLNPVRHCLYDLRAAVQYEGVPGSYSLTFATLGGPMERLYHYCIRDQLVNNIIPHAQLPAIEEHWAWNTGQTTADAPTSSVLRSYMSYGNAYDQASVDRILTTLATLITNGAWHTLDISNGAVPSAAGAAAASTLQTNGWTVYTA